MEKFYFGKLTCMQHFSQSPLKIYNMHNPTQKLFYISPSKGSSPEDHSYWLLKRLCFLNRTNYTCNYCKKNTWELEIYHLGPFAGSDLTDVNDRLLVSACDKCYQSRAHKNSIKNYLVTLFKSIGSAFKRFTKWRQAKDRPVLKVHKNETYASRLIKTSFNKATH